MKRRQRLACLPRIETRIAYETEPPPVTVRRMSKRVKSLFARVARDGPANDPERPASITIQPVRWS